MPLFYKLNKTITCDKNIDERNNILFYFLLFFSYIL
jgi:hypothetical protein